jgi:hypothetical protein
MHTLVDLRSRIPPEQPGEGAMPDGRIQVRVLLHRPPERGQHALTVHVLHDRDESRSVRRYVRWERAPNGSTVDVTFRTFGVDHAPTPFWRGKHRRQSPAIHCERTECLSC